MFPTSEEEAEQDDPDMYINLYLYTRPDVNNAKIISIRDSNTEDRVQINDSYNPLKQTKFVIHGFRSSLQSDTIQSIKNSYLQEYDYNVIGNVFCVILLLIQIDNIFF